MDTLFNSQVLYCLHCATLTSWHKGLTVLCLSTSWCSACQIPSNLCVICDHTPPRYQAQSKTIPWFAVLITDPLM